MQQTLRNSENLKRMLKKRGGFDCVFGFDNRIVQQSKSSVDIPLSLRNAGQARASIFELDVTVVHNEKANVERRWSWRLIQKIKAKQISEL
jgi:hypothetical protein